MWMKSIVVGMVAGASLALGLSGSALAQVEIPEGFEVVEIFRSSRLTAFPDINECGEIVFDSQMGRDQQDREIFLYDNGDLRRITDNDLRDRSAEINNAGAIVWGRTVSQPNDDEVILWQSGEETRLASISKQGRSFTDVAISETGSVAWARGDSSGYGCEGNVILWDGRTKQRLSNRNGRWDQMQEFNGIGDIVWQSMDVCANPWTAEIQLLSQGKVRTLPSSFTQLQIPSINDQRQVAWSAGQGVELWENGETHLLTANGRAPELNNLGDIFMYRWHDDIGRWQPWFVDGSSGYFYRLADDPQASHGAGRLNDSGEAVWWWNFGPPGREFGILHMRRIRTGDARFDGDVDLRDYADFAECMTGPRRTDRLCDCRFLDLDYDGDVDLGDFARFQNAFQRP